MGLVFCISCSPNRDIKQVVVRSTPIECLPAQARWSSSNLETQHSRSNSKATGRRLTRLHRDHARRVPALVLQSRSLFRLCMRSPAPIGREKRFWHAVESSESHFSRLIVT